MVRLVVMNWKGYVTTLPAARGLFKKTERAIPPKARVSVVVAPPLPFLAPLFLGYRGRIAGSAQDIAPVGGAETGVVTPSMVASAGASFALAGHAERRAQGDTDLVVAEKVAAILALRMTPIVCVGEALRDTDGAYLGALRDQVLASLATVPDTALGKVVIAYEPVWAIGAALPPSPRTVRETILFIRKVLVERFPRAAALKVRILYGGAVFAEHGAQLLAEGGVNGFLLGRASVDPDECSTLISLCAGR